MTLGDLGVGVTVRVLAVPVRLVEEAAGGRVVCQGCTFRVPAVRCQSMRLQAPAWGLPACSDGFVYCEVWSDVERKEVLRAGHD